MVVKAVLCIVGGNLGTMKRRQIFNGLESKISGVQVQDVIRQKFLLGKRGR